MNPVLKVVSLFLFATVCALPPLRARTGAAPRRNPNILTAYGAAGGPGAGFGAGLDYDRMLDDRGRFSFGIGAGALRSDDHSSGREIPVNRGIRDFKALQLAPALRYHPFGARHRADFSIGAQLATGLLYTRQMPARASGERGVLSEFSCVFLAPRLELGLNLRCGEHFIIGAFAAGGPMLAGNAGRLADGSAIRNTAFLQTGIRIGAAF